MGIKKILAILAIFLLSTFSKADYSQVKGKEGFWRVVQDSNKVWWLESPENKLEFMITVTSINPELLPKIPNTPYYLSKDKGKDWAEKTAKRVLEYGFKGAGAWSNREIGKHLPYTLDLNVIKCVIVPIDSPNWAEAVDEIIHNLTMPYLNDKNLIGYYVDNELDWDYLEPWAEKYFQTICKSIREHDPNHLILGVRFNRRPPLSVLQACNGLIDVNSINVYSEDGRMWKNHCREMYEITNSPIIVSEFSFFSDDNRSGNKNSSNLFPSKVKNQTERGEMYEFFVTGMATTSFIVGAEWFQFMDEPTYGRSDGEDYNFGVVDIFDVPYTELVEKIQKTSKTINDIHQKSDLKQLSDVWKNDPKRINYQHDTSQN